MGKWMRKMRMGEALRKMQRMGLEKGEVQGPVYVQGKLGLELGVQPNELGLFWCCGMCMDVSGGRMSLTWLPPDQTVGVCHYCGRRYEFGSQYGEEELADVVGVERSG